MKGLSYKGYYPARRGSARIACRAACTHRVQYNATIQVIINRSQRFRLDTFQEARLSSGTVNFRQNNGPFVTDF